MIRLSLLSFFLQPANGAVSSYVQLLFLNKGFSHSTTGVILSIGSLLQILFPIFISSYADRKSNEKRILTVFPLISAVLFVLVATTNSTVLTIICFSLSQGFFWCLNTIQDSYISKSLVDKKEKYGVIRSFGTFGYVVFMTLFGVVGFPNSSDNNQILLNICIFTLLTGLLAMTTKNYKPSDVKQVEENRGFRRDWFNKSFYCFMFIVFVSRIAEGVVDRLLGAYIKENLGAGNRFTIFVALGAAAEFFVLLFGGKLFSKKKITPITALKISCAGLFLRFIISGSTDSLVVFSFAQLLHGLGFGACHLAATSFIAQNVEEKHSTLAMSLYWSIAVNFAELIGTFIGGFVIEYLGYNALFIIFSVFPLISGILCFCFRKLLGT